MPEIVSLNETTYEVELLGGDKVEIGDKSSSDFKPSIKLNRWREECFIKVGLDTKVKGSCKKEADKLKWSTPDIEAHFYPLEPRTVIAKDKDGKDVPFTQNELGGFEFEIILKEKPKTNKIVLSIETQGLKFYYQPELTLEEIAEGCIRPDNVVGSYAVYHATRTNMHRSKADADKYKCGIAFHIYRPKITDAEGKWVWGELYYDEQAQTLTTTIPQNFLDTAVYPIRHVAGETFGYTTAGGFRDSDKTTMRSDDGDTPAGAGTATSMSALIRDDGDKFKLALYKDSDGSFVAATDEGDAPAADASFTTLNFASGVSIEAIKYLLVIWGGGIDTRYDTGVGTGYYYGDTAYPDSWPSPHGMTHVVSARRYSIYCTYTAAVAGWTHKYLGVANASIGKISGVAIADIKKVNGVE